jgi:glyoxylase-like metal-dependent hydrolase (beta-lactamase superfamily II)
MGSYLESLERVERLDPELVLPGHGRPFPDGARRARTIARGKRRRLDEVRDLVEAGARTVTELTEHFHPGSMSGGQRHFVMAELLADLAYYEVRGILHRDRRPDGVFVWSAGSR